MGTIDKVIAAALFVFGMVAVVVGAITFVEINTSIGPALERVNDQIIADLEMAEKTVRVLEEHPEAIEEIAAPRESLVATAARLPKLLDQAITLSEHAAQALAASASLLRGVASGPTLVVPDDAIEEAADALSRTSGSTSKLAPELEELQAHTSALAADFGNATAALDRVQQKLQAEDVTLPKLHERLKQTRQAVGQANIAAGAVRQVNLLGGIYILLGVALMGMAGIWKRLTERPRPESE